MSNHIKKHKIHIGFAGTLNVELNLFKIGNGEKGILVTSGIHGNEISGIIIIKELIKRLKNIKLNKAVYLLPSANPLALALRNRNNPIGNNDLNRSFPGNPNGSFSRGLAEKILSIATNMEVVIDLHTFYRNTPIVGMYARSTNKMDDKVLKFMKLFQLDCIYRLHRPKYNQNNYHDSSLVGALSKNKIPSFVVETPQHYYMNSDITNRVVDGILRIMRELKIVGNNIYLSDNLFNRDHRIPIYSRTTVYANQSGLFEPKLKIFDNINKGGVLGKILSLRNLKTTNVTSEITGKVITLKNTDFVRTGTKIASIGRLVKYLQPFN